jgi:sterol desaturase/sphingolipid hydroxylase (fatty acid hydroxylase superfamily)
VPLFPIAPFYSATVWYCLWRYRRDHRRAHLDPAWARDHLPCHYDHHMGDQDKNFAICWPWVDQLAGTREHFVGTDKELAQRAMHAERADKAMAGASERARHHKSLEKFVTRLLATRAGFGRALHGERPSRPVEVTGHAGVRRR